MIKIFFVLIAFLYLNNLSAQVIRDNRKTPKPAEKTKTVPVTIYPEVTLLTEPKVVLYEHGNFSGQSRSFGIGDYPLSGPADLNDKGSSFKIPNGWVAVIYEHANEKGGYGNYIDLMEDCADLSLYNFNDKVSYLRVFMATKPGYMYARNRMSNNQFVAGHWERERANGVKPDNSLPAVASSLSQSGNPDDYTYAPAATQAEIDELNDILVNQSGIAVLGGETTKPFYYHHNRDGEEVYKYNKVIDPARLPGKFFDWAADKMGRAGFIVKPFEVVTELATDIKDWIFGSSSTKVKMDCWYPVSEYRTTVCGTLKGDAFVCSQDYMHTQVTIDKDVCYSLVPSERFRSVLSNRWLDEPQEEIEGEVKPVYLVNYNTQTGKSTEGITPRNPLLLQVKKGDQLCMYGPWMGDILDLNFKIPIPFTDEKIELGNIDLRQHNEIHPINQMWSKKGEETLLIAVADGTGYFQVTGNGEVTASGLGQRMRFYKAFTVPAHQLNAAQATQQITVDAVGFDFTDYPVSDVATEILTVKDKGSIRLTVKDNSLVTSQKTHKVSLENVKRRPNGSLQGYIVIETEPIVKKGGSINIIVKETTSSGEVFKRDGMPVRVRE